MHVNLVHSNSFLILAEVQVQLTVKLISSVMGEEIKHNVEFKLT